MTQTAEKMAKGVRWDLSDLYGSLDDPKIEKDLKKASELASKFQKKYKPLLEALTPGGSFPLAGLIKDYEAILRLTIRLSVFAHLSFAEQTNNQAVGAFMQKIQVALTDIHNELLFFDVAWNRLDEKTAEQLMNDPSVVSHRHFLEHMRIYAPHTLTEGEEKIMSLKSNTGDGAFCRLFDEVLNNIAFYIDEKGAKVKKNESEVLALFHSPDRSVRKAASKCLAEGLDRNTHLLTYIYNMILADHRTDMKIRSYKHPMDARNLSNETELESILNLVDCVKKAYPIAQKYYGLKKKLLGLETLYDYDRYAPLQTDEASVSFDRCREIVLNGYHNFNEQAGKIVEQFFSKKWIDAEVREGKQGGGFCCQTLPEIHPYILVNYTGSMRDVMTVAHELGHGLHQYLAARKVGLLESDAPLTMAETASVFGEMIIFEKILEGEKDPAKQLGLVCGKIDDNFATVFRQIAMTEFELLSHDAGLKEGELSSERLSDFWIQTNEAFYGKSVVLTNEYRHGWKYIPHFIHTPFYCYAYSFAQLFVLTLYQKYKQDRAAFIPVYMEMLSMGGSKKPHELAQMAGLDIRKPDFWQAGIDLLDELVGRAETLAGSLS